MILRASMRTDIPAFYSEWFFRRLKAGTVCVRSPYNPRRVTRYRLAPELVDLFLFCTKDPGPMLDRLDELGDYGQYWFVTLTPYGPDIEPHVPDKAQVLRDFLRLAEAVGPHRTAWRYDPILISPDYPVERHLAAFSALARALEGAAYTAIISFIDIYKKVRRNFPQAREVEREERLLLGREMVRIAQRHGMTLKACAEGDELAPYGADCSGCLTQAVYEGALGQGIRLPKASSVRPGACSCFMGSDIGAYDTCGHLCRYCYANSNPTAAQRNLLAHDPGSEFLLGGPRPDDIVTNAKQESWLTGQGSFWA